jgi:hypothetical protein
MKKGDLSKFVEEAVQWRVFRVAVEQARDSFSDIEQAELEKLIDESVREVRAEKRGRVE